MSLGKRVAAMRKERGWSRWQLAQVSGLNQPRVSDIEKGVTENPRLDTLEKLAVAFGVSIDFLAHGRDMRNPGNAPKKDESVIVEVMAAVDPPPRTPQTREEHHALAAGDYKPGRRLIRAYGKSMWPTYSPKDLVLMDSNEKVGEGDVAVVRWSGRVIIARIGGGKDGAFVLKFDHPTWLPVEPGASAKIIGKVIKLVEGAEVFATHDDHDEA